jgi:hypothetical protein
MCGAVLRDVQCAAAVLKEKIRVNQFVFAEYRVPIESGFVDA